MEYVEFWSRMWSVGCGNVSQNGYRYDFDLQSGSAMCWVFLCLADDADDSFIQGCVVNFMVWIGELGVVGLLVMSLDSYD